MKAASASDRNGTQNTVNSRTPNFGDRLMEVLLVFRTRNFFLAESHKICVGDVCLSSLAVRYKDIGRLAEARSGPSKP